MTDLLAIALAVVVCTAGLCWVATGDSADRLSLPESAPPKRD